MTTRKKPAKRVRPVVTYDRNAVLDTDQLAAGIGLSRRSAEKLDLPTVYLGGVRRFVWGQVLDALTARAE